MKNLASMTALSLAVIFALGASAAAPEGYYNSLAGKSGADLKAAVKNVARKHTVISYGSSTWDVFKTSDTHMVGGQLVWWDMYSADNISVSSGHPGMNIEHSVANSWWGGSKNDAYKDIHHLNPSNSTANNRKSNFPLGEIATVTWDNGVTFVGKPVSGIGGGATHVYEPADEYKGDFARVFFYMFTIYDDISWKANTDWMYDTSSPLTLKPWAYEMMLRWDAADPVSDKERARNDAVMAAQHNRNPFIDCPGLARHIWGDLADQPYDPSVVPSDPTDPNDPNDPTDPTDPTDPSAPSDLSKWSLVTSTADFTEGARFCLVAPNSNKAMSSNLSGKYFSVSDATPVISGNTLSFSRQPADLAVLSITPYNGGYAIGMYDAKGDFKGYVGSAAAKSMSLSDSPESVAISVSANSTTLTFGKAKLLYNNSAPRFTTYTSEQEAVALYRLIPETTTGIDSAAADDSAVTAIFDLSGRRLATCDTSALEPGIYIVVSGTRASKIKIF